MADSRDLKSGWTVWRFDQMAVSVNDRVEPGDVDVDYYVGLEHLDPDSLKIRRWGVPSDVDATKLLFRKGDIIFGRRRVYQRKLGIAEFDGICSAHAMVLRPKIDVVLPEFLPFFLQSDLFMNRALEISVGSLSPTINWRTLAKQEFALPPPDEQRRIADCLMALEETIVSYDNAIDQTNNLRESFLMSLFSGHSRWPKRMLSDMVMINAESTKDFENNQWIDYIDIASVSYETGINEDEVKRIKYGESPSRARRVVRNNDILVSTVRINLRSFARVGAEFDGAVASTGFAVLRPNPELVVSNYLWSIIRSEKFSGKMFALSTGTNYPAVKVDDIGSFEFHYPPLKTQHEISKKMEQIDKGEVHQRKRLSSVKIHKAWLLETLLEDGKDGL